MSNTCDLSRDARCVQSNGYFGGPLSLSFSSPLFHSLFRSARLSRTFCTCLFLPCCSLQLLWRTLTLPLLVDADTSVFVELRRIYAAPSLHNYRHVRDARTQAIYTDLQFTGQRPLNDRSRRINRSARDFHGTIEEMYTKNICNV